METRRPQHGIDCRECNGTGLKLIAAAFIDRVDEEAIRCPACHGTGRIMPVKEDEPIETGQA